MGVPSKKKSFHGLVGSWWKGAPMKYFGSGHDSWVVVYFNAQPFKQKNIVNLEPHVKL